MRKGPRRLKKMILENGSYKLVALFVTVILWVTILGRRDFVLTRKMHLEIILPAPYILVHPTNEEVTVKVSGPRTQLREFSLSPNRLVLDLGQLSGPGEQMIPIPAESVDLPFGVHLVSITPDRVPVDVALARGTK